MGCYEVSQACLQWFDRKTLMMAGQEVSSLGAEGEALINMLGITPPLRAHQGWFFIQKTWPEALQKYFNQRIETESYDFFVAFPAGRRGPQSSPYSLVVAASR